MKIIRIDKQLGNVLENFYNHNDFKKDNDNGKL